jgi:hypothetical protein
VNTLHFAALVALFILVAGSLPGIGMAEMPSAASLKTQPANFQAGTEQQISNPRVTPTIVPQLGRRVIRFTLENHPYRFANVQRKGKYFPLSQEAETGKWFNHGGDKIWLLPEGSSRG